MSDPAENRKIWLKAAEENRALLDGRVKNDIEKYRKRPCKLRFIGADGKPLKNIKVRINQTSHDFGFGANIFMLDEFDSEEYNRRYRGEFKKYFNLATVPFYWDGLEPEEGKPRYDKNSPKVWRRPSPELCTEYCEENGIMPKLHCLVYDKFIPEWLPRGAICAGWKGFMRSASGRFPSALPEGCLNLRLSMSCSASKDGAIKAQSAVSVI